MHDNGVVSLDPLQLTSEEAMQLAKVTHLKFALEARF